MKYAALFSLVLLPSLVEAVNADPVRPLAAHKIDLGPISGTAYYTTGPEGYRVVATLSPKHKTKPMRFGAVLQPGQSVTVSIAGDKEAAPSSLLIARIGDDLHVRHHARDVTAVD